jgi:TolA-binding protein
MMHTRFRRFAAALLGSAFLVAAAAAPVAAASKEQQQMMADLRMLQEQSQILQNLIGTLMKRIDEVDTKLSQRLDDQANANRKALADSKLVIDGLSNDVRVVREKVDDNNVRIGSLGQEVEALRRAVQQLSLPPAVPPAGGDQTTSAAPAPGVEPAPGAEPGQTAAPTAELPPNIPVGASPERIWNTAQGDYMAGQYDLAVSGFQAYIMTAPTSDQADDAQVYIGNAYLQAGQNERAVEAFDTAIRTYPNGDKIPEAYFKKGLALLNLGERDRAREAFQYAVTNYPDTPEGILANQKLQEQPPAAGR